MHITPPAEHSAICVIPWSTLPNLWGTVFDRVPNQYGQGQPSAQHGQNGNYTPKICILTVGALCTLLIIEYYKTIAVKLVLSDHSSDRYKCGLLTHVVSWHRWITVKNALLGGLKGQALNTGGLKDRLDCIIAASLRVTCDIGYSSCGVHFHRWSILWCYEYGSVIKTHTRANNPWREG